MTCDGDRLGSVVWDVERVLDHGDWQRTFFFVVSWDVLRWAMVDGLCGCRFVAFDLDTIKLLMQLFVRDRGGIGLAY